MVIRVIGTAHCFGSYGIAVNSTSCQLDRIGRTTEHDNLRSTVEVTDNGTHSTCIVLVGSYLTSNFTACTRIVSDITEVTHQTTGTTGIGYLGNNLTAGNTANNGMALRVESAN